MNLILFNVQESCDEQRQMHKDHDVKMVTDLCTFRNIEFPDIKTNFKLGNKTSNSWRPLKLTFNSKK